MYVFCRPLSLCILYTTLAYFGFVAEQGLVNLHHHTLPTQEKRRVNRHQPPAADISQILVGLDSGRLADLGLLCSLGHRVLSHPPEDYDQPLLQGEFRLVKKGVLQLFLQPSSTQRHLLSNWKAIQPQKMLCLIDFGT